MNNSTFSLLTATTAILFSCGSVNKTISPAYNENRQVYTSDTLYLVKPFAVVKIHFGEGVKDFTIDSSEDIKAASELAYGIKKLGQKKITIIDLQTEEVQRKIFYQKMSRLLTNNTDSVYLPFKISDSLNLSSLVKERKSPIIISYLEWDYDTEDFYQKLYAEYSWQSGRSSSHIVFTKAVTTMKLNFMVIDPLSKEILIWRFKKYADTKIKKPTYANMRPVLPRVLQPFLKTVQKKNGTHQAAF